MAILKEAVWETCSHCDSRKRISDAQRGCDTCKKIFADDEAFLQFTVFSHDDDAYEVDSCSWNCALTALGKVETDYFVTMPMLHYDDMPEGARAQDFFTAIAKRRED